MTVGVICGGIREFVAFSGRCPYNVRLAHAGRSSSQCSLLKHPATLLAAARRERERMSAMEEIRSRKLQPIYNALERCVCVREREQQKQSILVDLLVRS